MTSTPQFEHRVRMGADLATSAKMSELRKWLSNQVGKQGVKWNWFIDRNDVSDMLVITFKEEKDSTMFLLKAGL